MMKKATSEIFLSQGHHEGKPIWHYLLVEKAKLPLLQEAAKKQPAIDVTEYGKILFCGWGSEPPESVVRHVKELYG